ncbi:MAG: DUF2232 domain-containing protein [Desulfuromonas sp.]|nr:DUF2232 domain-containing protein [Desulfuromonas sp.]
MAINFAMQENSKGTSVLLLVIGSVAITCGLQLLFQILGPFGVLLNPLLAFPVAYVCMRSGITPALLALVAIGVVVWQQAGAVHSLFYLLQFGGASLLLPVLLRRGVGWFRAIIVCLLVTVVAITVASLSYSLKQSVTIPTMVNGYIDTEVGKAKLVYEQADLSATQVKELLEVLDSTALFFKQAYVGLSAVAICFVLAATVALLCWFARGRYVVPGVLFHQLRMPDYLIWFLIVAGFSMLLKMTIVQQVSLNILTLLLPLYFLQGVAILSFFLRKKSFSTVSQAFAYMVVLVINPLPVVVTAIGVFDMWFDFRKPRVKTT